MPTIKSSKLGNGSTVVVKWPISMLNLKDYLKSMPIFTHFGIPVCARVCLVLIPGPPLTAIVLDRVLAEIIVGVNMDKSSTLLPVDVVNFVILDALKIG